jgi:hypothetical protein
MKAIGIQIEANEIILVVLKKQTDGSIIQTDECIRVDVQDHTNSEQIKQFRDQIESSFRSIKADRIAIRMRNAKAKASEKSKVRPPSPVSFKLEGIIQLYDETKIEFVWPQTITAFLKKHPCSFKPKHKYQQEAFDVAFYLINS